MGRPVPRLPATEYFAEPQAKTGIAIHHTVCDSVRTTVAIWVRDHTRHGERRMVATAYAIERDGTIYEAFDPACWAWQFGLSWPDRLRLPFEKRFIGIELCSEGGLQEEDGKLRAFGRMEEDTVKPVSQALDCGTDYRGYRWFDRYQPEQLDALGRLVDQLCQRFAIPRVYPDKPFLYYGDALASFEGVIGHAMVRPGKSDPAPDPRLWQTLRDGANLRPVPVTPAAHAGGRCLTEGDLQVMTMFNAIYLDEKHLAAGSPVQTLLTELARRGVYVFLKQTGRNSHTIQYQVLQGDGRHVARLARALGFKRVTDRVLEVHHA